MKDIEEIYNQYFNVVYKYLFCLTHNSDLAEELTQDVFCDAINGIDKFKGNCRIDVWLCKIAKNKWYDELRKSKKKTEYIDNIETIDENFDLENYLIVEDKKINLYKKIHELDNTTKEVIMLRINGELSFKEIGTIFNKTDTWARVTFYRGKKKLLEGDDFDE